MKNSFLKITKFFGSKLLNNSVAITAGALMVLAVGVTYAAWPSFNEAHEIVDGQPIKASHVLDAYNGALEAKNRIGENITSSGNLVGIGTQPDTETNANLNIGGQGRYPTIKFGPWSYLGTGYAQYPYLGMAIKFNPDTQKYETYHDQIRGALLTFSAGRIYLASGDKATANGQATETEITNHVTVNVDNGNVGIGTSDPQSRLEVEGNADVQSITFEGGGSITKNAQGQLVISN